MVGGGSEPKGESWGRVEDGDEGDLGFALRSSYSLAQARAATGLTHPSLTSRKSQSQSHSPPLISAWDTRLGRHLGLAKLADQPASLPPPTPTQPTKPSSKCLHHKTSFKRGGYLV